MYRNQYVQTIVLLKLFLRGSHCRYQSVRKAERQARLHVNYDSVKNQHLQFQNVLALQENVELGRHLDSVVSLALSDDDSWVSTVAHAMQQFLSCGHVPIDALLIVPTFEQVPKCFLLIALEPSS